MATPICIFTHLTRRASSRAFYQMTSRKTGRLPWAFGTECALIVRVVLFMDYFPGGGPRERLTEVGQPADGRGDEPNQQYGLGAGEPSPDQPVGKVVRISDVEWLPFAPAQDDHPGHVQEGDA